MGRTVRTGEGLKWAVASLFRNDRLNSFLGSDGNPVKTPVSPSRGNGTFEPIDIKFDGSDLEAEFKRIKQLHSPGANPVVVRSAALNWKATKNWSLDTFAQNYGSHLVPTDERDSDGKPIVITLAESISQIRSGKNSYTRFSPIMSENPELVDDLDLHALSAMSGSVPKRTLFQLFLGGAGTRTETHCAVGNNAFVQVHGSKIWRFVPPQFTSHLRPLPLGRPYFASAATLHDPSLATHPDAPVFEVRLEQGDVLLVPPFWWHQVDNPTESIGVASRWHHLGQAMSQSKFLFLMTLISTNPNLIQANRDRKRFGFVYQDAIDQSKKFLEN